MGLPQGVVDALQPGWTPLVEGPPAHWEVGLESIEVEGPGGGNITTELWQTSLGLPGADGSLVGGASSSGGGMSTRSLPNEPRAGEAAPPAGASAAAAPVQAGLAIMDSGATYTHLPRPAWDTLQRLMASAVAARGKVKMVVSRPSATCFEGLAEDTLTKDAGALWAAFPTLQLRFAGGASFEVSPEGYLVTPTTGGKQLICLSIFAWCAAGGPQPSLPRPVAAAVGALPLRLTLNSPHPLATAGTRRWRCWARASAAAC